MLTTIINLARIPDEELREKLQEQVGAKALLLSLKHIFDKNLQDYLETVLVAFLQEIDRLNYKDEIADILYYLYNQGKLKSEDRFWEFLHTMFSKNIEGKFKSLGQRALERAAEKAFQKGAEQGMQQGIHKGIYKGIQQNTKETALRMLNKKFDIKLISEVTSLSLAQIENLKRSEH